MGSRGRAKRSKAHRCRDLSLLLTFAACALVASWHPIFSTSDPKSSTSSITSQELEKGALNGDHLPNMTPRQEGDRNLEYKTQEEAPTLKTDLVGFVTPPSPADVTHTPGGGKWRGQDLLHKDLSDLSEQKQALSDLSLNLLNRDPVLGTWVDGAEDKDVSMLKDSSAEKAMLLAEPFSLPPSPPSPPPTVDTPGRGKWRGRMLTEPHQRGRMLGETTSETSSVAFGGTLPGTVSLPWLVPHTALAAPSLSRRPSLVARLSLSRLSRAPCLSLTSRAPCPSHILALPSCPLSCPYTHASLAVPSLSR